MKRLNRQQVIRICWLAIAFFLLTAVAAVFLHEIFTDTHAVTEHTPLQQGIFTLGGGVLLALLGTLCVWSWMTSSPMKPRPAWLCPVSAGVLSLLVMCLAYTFLGVYPVGEKSVMIVDMHHQYAPLLSELRYMLLEGGNFTYSFHVGLGANFISCFAYYLASPLNLLLMLFPERMLTEGILLITLLKNALCAAGFAACVQYLCRKRSATTVAVAVMYSMMLYMLAYSWNIMWLDGLLLLPVVVLCFERMMREGKWLGYVLTLALALFCNYYIGFMLCVFLVLYFVVWQVRSPRLLTERLRAAGYFAGGSLLGGGLVMALIVPVYLALGRTSAAGGDMPDFAATFDFFDLIGRAYYGATPTIRSGNLPNVYCGVLAVLCVPIYATQRSIPLRRRLSYVTLLAVLAMSCTINRWDLVWHGLHTPNDLPYRFSFLACFVALLMTARVLAYLTQIQPKQILGSLTASAAYLILLEKFGGVSALDSKVLYINLLLLAAYALVLAVGATRRMPVRASRGLVLLVVTAELLVGSGKTLQTMNQNEYFTARAHYTNNVVTVANAQAMRRVQEIADDAGDTFVRMEHLPRTTCMDTALYHYDGITTFASSNPETTTVFMGEMGYAVNGVNSYLYNSFVAPPDSLLGIKYVVLNARLTQHAQLELIDTVIFGSQTRYIYRNSAALPIGNFSTNMVREYAGQMYAPFDNQEALYTAMLGRSVDLYRPLTMTASSGSSIDDAAFHKNAMTAYGVFDGTVTEEGQYFAYVDCRAAESISVQTLSEAGEGKNQWGVTTYEPYIIDLGKLHKGESVQVTITASGPVSGNIHVVRLDAAAFNEAVAEIRAHGLIVTERTSTRVSGTVSAPQDGVVFYSIPYDAGWQATVDGQPATVVPIGKNEDGTDGAMLAVVVPAGEHTVEIRYQAPGQVTGLILSGVSAGLIITLWVLERVLRRLNMKQALSEQPEE